MGTPNQELTSPSVEHEGGLGEGADERAREFRDPKSSRCNTGNERVAK